MIELTHRNHFKFGYNGNHFNFRQSPADTWNTEYGVYRGELWSFRDECKWTARTIANRTEKPIYVCFSGGMDSEVVANSFMAVGVEFTPMIAVYNGGVNDYDTVFARRWCESRGLTPKLINYDLEKIWSSYSSWNTAISLSCISPQFLVYMAIIQDVSDLGGFPVFGSAECYLENNELPAHMFEREKVASMYRYCQVKGIESAIGFFQYTPDIMISYLCDPLVTRMVAENEFKTSKEFKYELYRNHFDLVKREPTSGFQKVWQKDKVLRDKLTHALPSSDAVNKHDYHQLVAALRGNK